MPDNKKDISDVSNVYRMPSARPDTPEDWENYYKMETAKNHEAEETNRKALELKFKEREDRRDNFWKFVSLDGTMVIIGIVILGLTAAFVVDAIMWGHAHFYR